MSLPPRPALVPPVPADALVLLVGGAPDVQARWLRARFGSTEILSLEAAMAAVCDTEGLLRPRPGAVTYLLRLLDLRLAEGSRTALDGSGLEPESLDGLSEAAQLAGRPLVRLVYRTARGETPGMSDVRRTRLLAAWPDAVEVTASTRLDWAACTPYPTAPGWIVIGDVHGDRRALEALLERCGVRLVRGAEGDVVGTDHPQGHRLAFTGDLVNRGPDSRGVLRLVRPLLRQGHVLVPGNHDAALGASLGEVVDSLRALAARGRRPPFIRDPLVADLVQHLTLDDLDDLGTTLRALAPYRVLRHTGGPEELVIAHAGLERRLLGRSDAWIAFRCAHGRAPWLDQVYGPDDATRTFAWEQDYGTTPAGPLTLAHGHWPILDARTPRVRGGTINLDTGAGRGNTLSALQWPAGTFVSVPGTP